MVGAFAILFSLPSQSNSSHFNGQRMGLSRMTNWETEKLYQILEKILTLFHSLKYFKCWASVLVETVYAPIVWNVWHRNGITKFNSFNWIMNHTDSFQLKAIQTKDNEKYVLFIYDLIVSMSMGLWLARIA